MVNPSSIGSDREDSPSTDVRAIVSGQRPQDAFGIPARDAVAARQTEAYKELVNKIAWCLGSTYRVQYSNQRSPIRVYAQRIARAVVRDHGYPAAIAKSNP